MHLPFPQITLQKPLAITHLPLDPISKRRHTTATHPTPRRAPQTPIPLHLPQPTTFLHPQPLPPFQFPLQAQGLLLLLSQVSFGAAGRELGARFLGLQFVDRLEEPFDLVAALGDVLGELLGRFVAPGDLGFEVAHGAVDVADRAEGCAVRLFLAFELGFELLRGGSKSVLVEEEESRRWKDKLTSCTLPVRNRTS